MTHYEWFRWLTFPIMPTHLNVVRHDLKRLVRQYKQRVKRPALLDVGGRKSPYTIGIPATISLLDVPQEDGTRQELNLGFTEAILNTIQAKRSNISDLVVEDMTKSTIEEATYDGVICVEVIEHVELDELFVAQISKVLKPGGWAYFTTPNGDYIKNEGPNKNPDHVRHYTKLQLQELLETYFDSVDVHYAVATGRYRVQGLKSYSIKKPLQTLDSIFSNIVNRFQSKGVEHTWKETAHLIAIGYK